MSPAQPARCAAAAPKRLLARAALAALLVLGVVGPRGASAQAPSPDEAVEGSGEEAGEAQGGARSAPPSDVEVIRIKGRAVTGIQTEVPTSVQQFSAQDLQALGAQNVSDLAKVTPNVEIKTSGSTAPTFFIRGVGLSDFSANAAGAVAIYRDDVAINAPAIQLTPLFDLENVEVLRGPQGTGSGRNASAGAIKMYSRKPTGDLGSELRTTVGNYGYQDFEGAVEAPVVEEVLASRFAFRYSARDGYGYNRCAPNSGLPPVQSANPPLAIDVPYSGPEDPRLPDPPTGALLPNGRPVPGPQFTPLCNESRQSGEPGTPGALNPAVPLGRLNPRFNGSAPGTPGIDAQGDPQFIGSSRLFDGGAEDASVNDLGNWAARGVFRFDPPWVDDMEWLLNVHGTRIDQLSTLGQVMGTTGGFLGANTGGGTYQEQDQAAELARIVQARLKANGGVGATTPLDADRRKLAERLALRLDENPWDGDYNETGQTTLDNWGLALTGDWTVGPVTLTSTSGYERYWRARVTDQDFSPETYFEADATDDAWQFFQELKLHGELEETPLRWEVGAYYLQEPLNFADTTVLNLRGTSTSREYTQDLYSYAVYGGFGWDFLDDFTVEGGVRWNYDRKNLDFKLVGPGVDPNTPPVVTHIEDSAPTGALTLTYRFNEEVSSYWKYSHGWKPGTFNTVAQSCEDPDDTSCAVTSAEPEQIDAWETGLRGTWLDGALTLGSALFFYKYSNYQVFIVKDSFAAPPVFTIVNANDAQVYGAELDLRIEPLLDLVPPEVEGLVINARAGWLESEFLDFTNIVTRPGAIQGSRIEVEIDASGNQLINSPRFKVSGSAEWTFDFGRFGALIPRYDLAWSSDIYFDPYEGRGTPDNFGEPRYPKYTTGQRRYWLHNVRLAYRVPEGNIEIAGWCRNVTNLAYKTYAFDASTFSNVVLNFVGEPRTYGMDFTVRF